MDITDRLIVLTKELRFKSNISKLVKARELKDGITFVEVNDMDEFILFKKELLTYGYLSNIDEHMIERIVEIASYPLYMTVDKHLDNIIENNKPLSLMIALYDKTFVDIYSSSYDISIIDMKEMLNTWI